MITYQWGNKRDANMSAVISGDRARSHDEVMERALRAAAGFRALGVGPESAIALMLRNDFPLFEASRGAAMAGGYFVPINWHFKGGEVRYILQDCDACALVIHADLLPQVKAFVNWLRAEAEAHEAALQTMDNGSGI